MIYLLVCKHPLVRYVLKGMRRSCSRIAERLKTNILFIIKYHSVCVSSIIYADYYISY